MRLFTGEIITMDHGKRAEVLLEKDGKILFVGSKENLPPSWKNAEPISIDYGVIMPGFFDCHSHFLAVARTIDMINLETATSFDEIKQKFEDFMKGNEVKPGQFLIGYGYDHNKLAEGRHPDRFFLDKISTKQPILITHCSGHMGVVNTTALSFFGIDEQAEDPVGGKYGRDGTGKLNGYFEEQAFMRISKAVPRPTINRLIKGLQKAQQLYFSYGICCIQEGMTLQKDLDLLKKADTDGIFQVPIVYYFDLKTMSVEKKQIVLEGKNLKFGGYKIFLDGSPQSRTAWMSEPYRGQKNGGYPIYTDEEVVAFMETAAKDRSQLLVHANGDAACEQMLRCGEALKEEIKNLRFVMIHSQFVRKDQLARMKVLGMIPSFFISHIIHWGDVHRKNLGDQRAFSMSPAYSAKHYGLAYTFHQDSPVIKPDMMELIWQAVLRKDEKEIVYNSSEQLSIYDAFCGITKNGAWQYGKERTNGILKKGYQADFVVLDKDPWKISIEDLSTIKVMETFIQGRSVWKRM